MRLSVIAALAIIVFACTSAPIYTRGPLATQLLRPRMGHEGRLTTQFCKERKGEDCVVWDLIEYDLRDAPTRGRLRDAKVVCNVAGRVFFACMEKPGLCTQARRVTRKFWFVPIEAGVVETDFVDAVTGYQRLLDSDTVCAAQDSFMGQRLF